MPAKFKVIRLFRITLAFLFLAPLPAMAAGPNIVHIQANQNCCFGGTESLSQAEQGVFGTVQIQKGNFFDWTVSHNGAILYYGSIPATGGPMPSHMPMKGSTHGGASVFCP
jgi:hypothetical protein